MNKLDCIKAYAYKYCSYKLFNKQDGVHKQIIGLACPESSKVAESLKSNDLISNVATAASLLKYDYQIAKSHLIQQLCHSGMFT